MKNNVYKISLSLIGCILSLTVAAQIPLHSASRPLDSESVVAVWVTPEVSTILTTSTEQVLVNSTQAEKEWENTVEKIKKISRSFDVNAQDKLDISNQFGEIRVHTWAKNEIKVDIEIKGYGKNENDAQHYVDMVRIIEKHSSSLIDLRTELNRNLNNTSWTNKLKGIRRGVEINYVINMPAKNPLDISNKYGNTILPDFDGPLNISNDFGSFTAQRIDHQNNTVNVRYGSANINSLEFGTINVTYGSLKIGQAKNIQAKTNYGNMKIENLNGGGNIWVGYGNLKVESFNQVADNWNINASYSGVSLGISDQANFNFEVTTSFGGFSYPDDKVTLSSKNPNEERGWNPTKTYKGKVGKGSSALVSINAGYGNVKFN